MLDLYLMLVARTSEIANEYDTLLDTDVKGLTSGMRDYMKQHITRIISNMLNNEYPIITHKLVLIILQALDASIIALFTIRPKSSFKYVDIKDYLYTQLIWLFDVDEHYPTILGDYLVIDDETTMDSPPIGDEPIAD